MREKDVSLLDRCPGKIDQFLDPVSHVPPGALFWHNVVTRICSWDCGSVLSMETHALTGNIRVA